MVYFVTDIDKSCDKIFCHICHDDHKGRKVKEKITDFSLKYCDQDHQKKYLDWKNEHPFHSFQKKKFLIPIVIFLILVSLII